MLPALMKKESPAFKVVVVPFFVERQNAFLHISRDRTRMSMSALSASGRRNFNCDHDHFIAWYGQILCEQYLTLHLSCVGWELAEPNNAHR
jgi:hypothetical protein